MATVTWDKWTDALPGIEIEEADGGHTEEKLVRIDGLSNAFEASILSETLKEESIPHSIEPHADTAYGNLFQLTRSWGSVVVPARDGERTLSLLLEIRESFHSDDEENVEP